MTAAFRRHCSIQLPLTGLWAVPNRSPNHRKAWQTAAALNRCAVTLSIASALLAACGGSQPPIGAPDATPQSREPPGPDVFSL